MHVSFSPVDTQHIISVCGDKIWWLDVNGHQISPTLSGSHINFSLDHTQFSVCDGQVVTVYQNSDSREIVTELHVADNKTENCCFSPNGRLVAATVESTIYVWDITSPYPHLVETFVGHAEPIASLVFSSPFSLISASDDESVKFWKIGDSSTNLVTTGPGSTQPILPPIQSVSLQARDGIAISSDTEGVVKTWDISTGLCKASFQTPAEYYPWRDTCLIDGRLIIVWYEDGEIHIWDINKGESIQTVDIPLGEPHGTRISGDGSKVFYLTGDSIQAWSLYTGEAVGEVEMELDQQVYLDSLQADGSRIWIQLEDSSTQGWDFGVSGPPIPLSIGSTGRPLLEFIGGPIWQDHSASWVKNTVTGREVFRLSGRYAKPSRVQWDGQYLVAGYGSGEILILDFHDM